MNGAEVGVGHCVNLAGLVTSVISDVTSKLLCPGKLQESNAQ